MLFAWDHRERLRDLQERLRRAGAITPELIDDVVARTCRRLHAYPPSAKARITRLAQSGAFADATLALLELELPSWKLRRLLYEDGGWHCALSQRPELPIGLDQTVEASHEILPLAILSAFIEARLETSAALDERPQTVPQAGPTSGDPVCCENFG